MEKFHECCTCFALCSDDELKEEMLRCLEALGQDLEEKTLKFFAEVSLCHSFSLLFGDSLR